jgi:AcrR family transcriptional regulator
MDGLSTQERLLVSRSRGRPSLPLDRIVGAALELVDEQGADALTMRTLAQRLGSGTATLYRHFDNRAELVAMVVDRMLGEVSFDASAAVAWPWDRACEAFAQNMFEALGRHGNVASLLIGRVPMGPNALAQRELLLSLLLNNGFSAVAAARSFATLSRYILGFAMQASGSAPGERHAPEISATFRRLDADRFPATVAVAEHLPVPLADEFAYGLRLIIDGLTQHKA